MAHSPYFERFSKYSINAYERINSIKTELRQFSDILDRLIQSINPINTVAVGKKAEQALRMVGIKAEYVRHPSRCGAKAFEKRMKKIFSKP